MSRVAKCMCEECQYNKNYQCYADSIEIRSNNDTRVISAEGTCCETFQSKVDDEDI
jgi:hypothetical protein